MWTHPKLKKEHKGNYELLKNGKRVMRLERENAKGKVTGKVYVFGNHKAARKAGWVYTK